MLRPDSFPGYLAERITDLTPDRAVPPHGRAVVYWMRSAIRAHENPALDVAISVATALQQPLLVYHALSERYPHASDRHHTFILEGARDVEAECTARGIPYVFHLEHTHGAGAWPVPVLKQLSLQVALLVTETMPVPPLHGWTQSLAQQAPCPVWSVDTACVVPMALVGHAPTRAFSFRERTAALRAQRVSRAWPRVAVPQTVRQPHGLTLPFTPVVLAGADIPTLVASCAIDHSIGPVPHTEGGSVAGYARWRAFVDGGHLARYAARRNDATGNGVSRMSAYLHYGMVSPFALARECAELQYRAAADGATKYLDELLVWRELAYAFCFWQPSLHTTDAIPPWARETLAAHHDDPRELLSWDVLARSRTGDALWDAAQTSLRHHGELHNNVRMTWGKALLGWSATAQQALDRLIDLNHRYALDGRDPASYGGLLWCLGQFDRPFAPELPVLGTVRPRSTAEHAQRLPVPVFVQQVSRPAHRAPPRVLIIGAGLAGLAAARTLTDHGWPVTVLDKGRGPGGRVSTRRTGAWCFDHGTQHLNFGERHLQPLVSAWVQDGVLSDAMGRLVGVDTMSRLGKHIASDLTVHVAQRVTALEHSARGWQATTAAGLVHEADVVLLAIPALQAVELLTAAAPTASAAATAAHTMRAVQMAPCWSTMVVFDAVPSASICASLEGGALRMPQDGRLATSYRECLKPGREPHEAWVVHSGVSWSTEHLEQDAPWIAREVSSALHAALAMPGSVVHAESHRWRYARVRAGLSTPCLWDAPAGLGVAGDFAYADRATMSEVERAWCSGIAVAGRVLALP